MTSDTQTHPALTPSQIGKTPLKNRYILAPMSRASATKDGIPTPEMAEYYARFAKGGFGLLIAEGAYPQGELSQSYANQPGLCSDAHQRGWTDIANAVHNEGGKIVLQLIHAGAVSQVADRPKAPSAIQPQGHMLQMYGYKQGPYAVPEVFSDAEVEDIKAGFVQAAVRAQKAGLDGVEVHCANGYLLDQFLTPEMNTRTAPYGGSVENRIRLTSEIISEIRDVCAPEFIVGVRLSQAKATQPDYFWQGGAADAKIIFKAVKSAGADYIHIASEIKGYEYHCTSTDGTKLTPLARDMTGLPVIANGGLHDPDLAAKVLSENEADFLAVGKSAMVNPDLPNRIASGLMPRAFTFDVFSKGVSIMGQREWEQESQILAVEA